MSNNTCPICGLSGSSADGHHNSEWHKITCKECSTVYLSDRLWVNIFDKETNNDDAFKSDIRFKMACLLYAKTMKGNREPIAFWNENDDKQQAIPDSVPCYYYREWIKTFPADPLAKIDNILLNFRNVIENDLSRNLNVIFPSFKSFLNLNDHISRLKVQLPTKILFCNDANPCHELATLMDEMGYANQKIIYGTIEITSSGECIEDIFGLSLRITAKGWQRISELLDQQSENSETCFVAMAFNKNTDQYREAVRAAVRKAGYRADEIAVDETHHNNFIMDKVINMINEARFVIADFTTMPEEDDPDNGEKIKNGVRGGVYWEAGYARGQNKEVIHTRRDDDDSRRRLHFDIEQINTLFWKENDLENFSNRLTERIKATVGKGPLPIL